MLAKIFEIENSESWKARMVAEFYHFNDTTSFESSAQDIVKSKFIFKMPISAVPIAEIESESKKTKTWEPNPKRPRLVDYRYLHETRDGLRIDRDLSPMPRITPPLLVPSD